MAEKWIGETQIGRWTVLGQSITKTNGEVAWLCRCSCGTERYVLERSLRYGGSCSCGCLANERARSAVSHKLDGKTFGDLTVLHVASTQKKYGGVFWTCRCSCGKEVDVPATMLVQGRRTHCGCKPSFYSVDIRGQKFRNITALYPTEQRTPKGDVIWHCRCDCGKEFKASYNNLVYSNLQSCGCQKKLHDAALKTFLTHVSGTSVDMIRSKKTPTNNTSGVRGVYFIKGKWSAKIVFQKKQYHLGSFDSIDDAAFARKEAEQLLFDGAAAHYDRWKQRADEDPAWAASNPISISVERKVPTGLTVTFLPVMEPADSPDQASVSPLMKGSKQ